MSETTFGCTAIDGEILLAGPMNNRLWLRVRPDAPDAEVIDQVVTKGMNLGTPAAFMPIRQAAVHVQQMSDSIQLLDMASGQVVMTFKAGTTTQRMTKVAAASPDEKWLAAISYQDNSQKRLLVWDTSSGLLVVSQLLPWFSAEALAFSQDSSRIACAHSHHAISEWDLTKLQSSAKPLMVAPPPQPAKVVAANGTKPWERFRPKHLSALPAETRTDSAKTTWQFLPEGEINIGVALKSAGQLSVGGQRLKSEGLHVMAYPECDYFRDTMATECSAMDGKLCVSRYFSRPDALKGLPTFIDTFHNLSDTEIRTTVAFTVPLPSDVKVLMDSTLHPITVAADGRLALAPDVIWVAPSQWGKAGEPLPIFRFHNLTSAKEARVYWDAARHVLRAEYEVVFAPHSTRHLMHQVFLLQRDPQALPDVVTVDWMPDMAAITLPVVRDRGINFGRLRKKFATLTWPTHLNDGDDWAVEPLNKDMAGFVWTGLPGMGIEGEMGASALNLMRINDKPLPFIGPSVYPARQMPQALRSKVSRPIRRLTTEEVHHPELVPEELLTWNLEGSVQISRHPPEPQGLSGSLCRDGFYNNTDQPVSMTVSYVTLFRSAPVALWDVAGHDIKSTATAEGGAFAIEVEGPQRPATLMKYYWAGSPAKPRLRWLSERLLSIDFDLTVPPRSQRRLVQLVGQRLLDTGGDLATQFSAFDRSFGGYKQPTNPAAMDTIPLNCRQPAGE